MHQQADNLFETKRGTLSLWLGVLGGPTLWFINQQVNAALTPWACRTQHVAVLHVVSAVCLAGTLLCGASARHNSRWADARLRVVHANYLVRGRFMAQLGVLSALLFAIVIVAMELPNFLLDPCGR
jgi:hypothetical protein